MQKSAPHRSGRNRASHGVTDDFSIQLRSEPINHRCVRHFANQRLRSVERAARFSIAGVHETFECLAKHLRINSGLCKRSAVLPGGEAITREEITKDVAQCLVAESG